MDGRTSQRHDQPLEVTAEAPLRRETCDFDSPIFSSAKDFPSMRVAIRCHPGSGSKRTKHGFQDSYGSRPGRAGERLHMDGRTSLWHGQPLEVTAEAPLRREICDSDSPIFSSAKDFPSMRVAIRCHPGSGSKRTEYGIQDSYGLPPRKGGRKAAHGWPNFAMARSASQVTAEAPLRRETCDSDSLILSSAHDP